MFETHILFVHSAFSLKNKHSYKFDFNRGKKYFISLSSRLVLHKYFQDDSAMASVVDVVILDAKVR